MKPRFSNEFIYQIFALLIAFIVVHALYVALIRPNAESFLEQERAAMAENTDYVQKTSFYVVVRDYEQESCFILMLWAFAILAYKGKQAKEQQLLLGQDLLDLPELMPIHPEDVRGLLKKIIERAPEAQHQLLPRALRSGLQRFETTQNVQSAATATRDAADSLANRMESELSIIRYIAWAIPSVGFIGTVRGIGDALSQAHRAVEGDIAGVTESLGVAFNSTFIALVISIVLMFFIHQLQLMQESLVLDTENYCDDHLIRRMQVRQ